MTVSLLPDNFDELVGQAVHMFWHARGSGVTGDGSASGRTAVVGGKNMDGFIEVVRAVVAHCDLPTQAVHVRKSQVVLPGFFRATKNWDVLVVHEGRLLGVFELKSQVGSFGNNLNNRAEEVIGSAADLWVAHHHGAYGGPARSRSSVRDYSPALLNPALQSDPRPPFLAWLMLLEECDDPCVRCVATSRTFPCSTSFATLRMRADIRSCASGWSSDSFTALRRCCSPPPGRTVTVRFRQPRVCVACSPSSPGGCWRRASLDG